MIYRKNITTLPGAHTETEYNGYSKWNPGLQTVYNTFTGKAATLLTGMCEMLGFAVGISFERRTSRWRLLDVSGFSKKFHWTREKMVNFNDISLRWLEFILIINSNSTRLPLQVQNIFYLEEKVQTHIHTNPNNPPQYNLEGQIKTIYKVICSMWKCLQNITTSFLVFRDKQYNCFKYMLILLFHIKLHLIQM